MGKLIRSIFFDIISLYKNFLHFNLSKIIISLCSILYLIICMIPFIVISGIIYFYYLRTGDLGILDNYIFYFFIIIAFIVAIISILYYFVLQTNLNLSYIDGNRLKYSKNFYFNLKLFLSYFKLMLLSFFILILPFLVYKSIVFLLINISGGEQQASALFNSETINYFNISVNLLRILALLSFIYLSYKTLFSVVILVDESKGVKFQKTSYYIFKSFSITKGFKKALSFILTFLIVIIASSPITFPLNYIAFNNIQLSNYIDYKTNTSSNLESDFYYLQSLEYKYSDRDLSELSSGLSINRVYEIFFEILNFLIIFGLFEMFIVSFYFRKLISGDDKIGSKQKAKKIPSEGLVNDNIETKSIPSSLEVKKVVKSKLKKSVETKKDFDDNTKSKSKKSSIKKTQSNKASSKNTTKNQNSSDEKAKISTKRGRPRKNQD